jgi:enoyl-CoA hydratase/carnithine racemase
MKTEYKTMAIEMDSHTAVMTINNGPVPVVNPQLLDDLEDVLKELSADKEVWALVISSSSEKIFLAGADVKQFLFSGRIENMRFSARNHKVFGDLAAFPHPVICAVNGLALGGGLELAISCDLRVMDKKAKVGFPEGGLGIVPGAGGTQRLSRLIGVGKAKYLIYTAKQIRAEEAYALGLCEVLAEPGECLTEAKKLASAICLNSPKAIAADKQIIDLGIEQNMETGLFIERSLGSDVFETKDKAEGAAAFREKRRAVFKNE